MTERQRLTSFKAYDIRGRVPDELNAGLAWRIGRAYVEVVKPRRVVLGHDIRLTGPTLVAALTESLTDSGVDVCTIGQCGTEEIYFATAHLGLDGGIMVTASHNPKNDNGMKLVRQEARPISGDTGLLEIERLVRTAALSACGRSGRVDVVDTRPAYVGHLLHGVDLGQLRPLKIVVNAGNGSAGPVVDALEPHLPFTLIKVQHTADGHFPNGVPNPLLLKNRAQTADVVRDTGADLGVAWDGDFDRCFFFDETGAFVDGYYIVGLLAQIALAQHPGSAIIYDPRLTWNTIDLVTKAGGRPVRCKSGHAFIKERMREEDAVYGGEMSAHHYFRDFFYCDSGMIPWLQVAQAVSQRGPLSQLIAERQARFPISGEINRRIPDPAAALAQIRERYGPGAQTIDETDGLGVEYATWRFNLRLSNTEPLIRLNVETQGDETLLTEKTDELLAVLATYGAVEA